MADSVLFTCLSCSMAFSSAEEQRLHYRADHHRYNMKRRVAGLPPVTASVFNDKVREQRQETSVVHSSKDFTCFACSKVYTTENAYKTHMLSRKHREAILATESRSSHQRTNRNHAQTSPVSENLPRRDDVPTSGLAALTLSKESPEYESTSAVDEKIAAARVRLSTTDCLFCPTTLASLEENLVHMSLVHSFFIPDFEYLIDITGLIIYLGEKIAVGNVCISCNGKSREFRTLEAVRKHMVDKSHCKIAYETEEDRLEFLDFYDFTSSYPDHSSKNNRRKETGDKGSAEEEWEDIEDDGLDVDDIVEEKGLAPSISDSDDESFPDNQITYGDTEYELVLPSGIRIGHRYLKRYYAQSFRFTRGAGSQTHDTGVALVRRLLADKNSALVPRKGGYGAFGLGTDAVMARNAGEARNAGRHVREHRDQRRREEFKTRVAFKHNHQKHYRDPLLQ